jgi:hypothetical protein
MPEDPEADPSPAELLGDMLGGFQVTQALYVAAKLNIFDVLRDRPQTSREIAEGVGAHEPSLRRLLGFLTTIDVLAVDGQQRFAPTAMGELLQSDHPDSERPWALLLGAPVIWRPWGELYESIMTGRPAFNLVFGKPYFEYLASNQQDAAVFNAAMTSSSSDVLDILDAYDFSAFTKIVDVGGGQGALLQGILERYPHARGILYDLPSVVADAKGIRDSAVAARCEVVGGDMFQAVPDGADAYLLKRILHDWSDAEAIQVLRNCREAMSDQGKVLAVERVLPPSIQADSPTSADLMMLVLVTGRERTEAEFGDLYSSAGLRLTRLIPAGGRSLIEGVRA